MRLCSDNSKSKSIIGIWRRMEYGSERVFWKGIRSLCLLRCSILFKS